MLSSDNQSPRIDKRSPLLVAVTGGTGFIGRRLVRQHLAQGDSVRILSRDPVCHCFPDSPRLTLFQGDLGCGTGDLSAFVKDCDILYHCAGEVRREERMHMLHINGTRRLINCAGGRIGHWVQLGSVGSYGLRQGGVITESEPVAPQGIYEITKTNSDQLVTRAAREGQFSCTVLRPSIVFGPDMGNQSLFQLITAIDQGRFCFIGSPGASANYIHVDNVVKGLILCGKKMLPGVTLFNLSDHRTMEQFVSIIADCLDRPMPKKRIPLWFARLIGATLGRVPGFPLTGSRVRALSSRTLYSMDAICSALGFTLCISMEEGLAQMVTSWKKKNSCRVVKS